MLEYSCVAERLSASEVGLNSMEFVSQSLHFPIQPIPLGFDAVVQCAATDVSHKRRFWPAPADIWWGVDRFYDSNFINNKIKRILYVNKQEV
jgi:hypothetical protein